MFSNRQLARRGEEEPALPDIDAADKENPLACTSYVKDIYAFFRRVEVRLSRPRIAEGGATRLGGEEIFGNRPKARAPSLQQQVLSHL